MQGRVAWRRQLLRSQLNSFWQQRLSEDSAACKQLKLQRYFSATTEKAKKGYAASLNLPQTDFPMRASAAEREPLLMPRTTHKLYKWQSSAEKDTLATDKVFQLHDGPPYANGSLHIGHLVNKVLKDFINRFHLLRGYRVHYRPGWDCHGLPIELKALQSSAAENAAESLSGCDLNPMQIRTRAKQCALEAIKGQHDDFQRWGVMAQWDWENDDALAAASRKDAYLTMDPAYEAVQLRVFKDMLSSGLIYRGFKPVYWSPSSRTALAEAELEYSDSTIFRFVGFRSHNCAFHRVGIRFLFAFSRTLERMDILSICKWSGRPGWR